MNKVIPIAKGVMKRSRVNNQPGRLTGNVPDVVADLRPAKPLYILWPERIAQAAKNFMTAFPGETMFAVKTNPSKTVISALYQAGMRSFDCASIEEIRLVRKVSRKASIYFMHTIKSPEAISEAYRIHGVRSFSFDTMEELNKIMVHTEHARDLNLFVRFAPPKNGKAAIDFSAKFGAAPDDAVLLLQASRLVADKVGLCFHVGTQTVDPTVYGRALHIAGKIIRESGVQIDLLDVGGGFPVSYPGDYVQGVPSYVDVLKAALKKERLDHIPLLAEPGRVLVAEGGALVARVELRKGRMLYLNDGTYGGLFDAGPLLKTKFPVRAIRPNGEFSSTMGDFSFSGPTCDSLDMMAGPFTLPADITTGDWIEIGNLGAYSQSMRTNFNGFGAADTVSLYDR